ncbi:hypothetical protein MP638_006512, partial [Amoeboaphelidium occidentale]
PAGIFLVRMSQQHQTDNTSANMDTDPQAPSHPSQPSIELTDVVKKLPQYNEFEGSSYYVRKCYEDYYGYINDALNNEYKIIT